MKTKTREQEVGELISLCEDLLEKEIAKAKVGEFLFGRKDGFKEIISRLVALKIEKDRLSR